MKSNEEKEMEFVFEQIFGLREYGLTLKDYEDISFEEAKAAVWLMQRGIEGASVVQLVKKGRVLEFAEVEFRKVESAHDEYKQPIEVLDDHEALARMDIHTILAHVHSELQTSDDEERVRAIICQIYEMRNSLTQNTTVDGRLRFPDEKVREWLTEHFREKQSEILKEEFFAARAKMKIIGEAVGEREIISWMK